MDVKIKWQPYQMGNLVGMLIHVGFDPAEFYTRHASFVMAGELLFPYRLNYDQSDPSIVSFLQHPVCCEYLLGAVLSVLQYDTDILWRVFFAQSLVYFREKPHAPPA